MSDFWSMPIGSRRDPTIQGELGPVYRDAAGNAFQVMPQNRLAAMNDRPQAGNALLDVLMPMGNWQNALAAAWEGLTAPRRAMQGEPVTYGETFGTALDAMGGGAFSTAPKGALRSGPIRAYHGSPHDFDKFSMEKIGTGEGAQAYGHGLYFAEAEDVAQAYKKALGGQGKLDGINARLSELAKIMDKDAVPGGYRQFRSDAGRAAAQEYDELMTKRSNLGHMYEVNINADPDDFLDWDAPLSEQSPKVRNALAENWMAHPVDHAHQTGADILGSLHKNYGGEIASDEFKQAGIPGIKYRDQGSRGVDGAKATRNFVVFDDSMIEIIRKYGIAAAAPMLGLTVEELRSQMEAQGI